MSLIAWFTQQHNSKYFILSYYPPPFLSLATLLSLHTSPGVKEVVLRNFRMRWLTCDADTQLSLLLMARWMVS